MMGDVENAITEIKCDADNYSVSKYFKERRKTE